MGHPDVRSDDPMALQEAAVPAQHRADVPLLHPSGERSGASDGARPVASADANPAVHLALHHPAGADAGRSAVHAPERAEAQAVPLVELGPCKPDVAPSAERSDGAAVPHHALLVRAVLWSDEYQASPLELRVLSAFLSQASQLSPRVRKASEPRVRVFLPPPQVVRWPRAFQVLALPASQLLREVQEVFRPSMAGSPRPPVVRPIAA